MSEQLVPIDHLRVGVFIRLQLKWYEHPFLFNGFKIRSPDQIQVLRDLGLSQVLCDPSKSDRQPGPPLKKGPASDAAPTPSDFPLYGPDRLWEIKKERIQRLRERNRRIQHCDKQYLRTFGRITKLMQNVQTGYTDTAEEGSLLIQDMVESLLSERDVVVHLMNAKGKDEGIFYHTLNVALLSLLIGKEYGIDVEDMKKLGLGALFHDIGKNRIPKKILNKRAPLTPAERELLKLHPKYGEEMACRIKGFPEDSIRVIRQHHETRDGGGYPDGLNGGEISVLARIMAIANVYDNYCNHWSPEDCLTPHEAMSVMYGRRHGQLDDSLLAVFIRCMGIYPPGTIVRLSNDLIGMVVSVSRASQLRPSLLIYDPEIPSKEAMILDMEDDPELTIVQSIRPCQLTPEVYAYLNPRVRVSYFFEPSGGGLLPASLRQ